MRGMMIVGVVLVVIGAAALLFGQFSYSTTEKAADIGPVQVNVEKEHHVSIPTIAGIVVIIAGIGVMVAGRSRA